ncbi:MAG TPA: thioesterase family protein [Streptosporangiaceae bacterium]
MIRSAPDTPVLKFSEVTALTPDGPGWFDAVVSPEWTIGGKPNGGYLLAILGRAASSVSRHRHVIAASAHYLRSPDPGPVRAETDVLRIGRSASHIRARMSQNDKTCVEALLTMGDLGADSVPYWDSGSPPSGQAEYEDCPRLVPQVPIGRVAIMDQVEVRLDPASSGFTTGQPDGRGEVRGWLTLPGDEAFDPTSLLYAVDAFPPATFNIELTGWVPTLELTVYVRALPAPGPVRVLQKAQLIAGQRVDESCFIWDHEGRLVAQATQLAGIRLG